MAHAYPMKRTIYLSHRVGFLTNLRPTCGVLPSAFLTGLLSENRSVPCSKEQTKETTIGWTCGGKLRAVSDSVIASNQPSGSSQRDMKPMC